MSPPPPQSTLIYGGSGKLAKHLTRLLVSRNHKVYSIIRQAEQTNTITGLGATPIVQSIEESSLSAMVETLQFARATTVIWSAGAGGGSAERTAAVDRDGAIKAMDAAAQAGVKRFVMVSAVDVRERERAEPEWYDERDREVSEGMWGAIGPYMEAKLAADKSLVEENGRRGLEWTIVRPGRLSEESGTGKVRAGKVHLADAIPREDVAAVVAECLRVEGSVGLAFDVVGGGEVDVAEAVEGVVKDRVDCFEGRH